MAPKRKLVSVIVPAYKTERFIVSSLKNTDSVLSQTRYKYEIICVIDGVVDKSYELAKRLESKMHGRLRVLKIDKNSGKGNAVRFGMQHAKGDIVGYIDAGFDINPNGISMLLEHFEWYGADIIIGSKRHPASKVNYTRERKIISFVYQILVKILFGLRVRDTQVGLKFFRKKVVKDVVPRVLVKQFAFDIEMLAVANYLGYKRIFEAPIELSLDFNSSSITSKGFIRTVFLMVWDTMAVFYRLKVTHYYDRVVPTQ